MYVYHIRVELLAKQQQQLQQQTSLPQDIFAPLDSSYRSPELEQITSYIRAQLKPHSIARSQSKTEGKKKTKKKKDTSGAEVSVEGKPRFGRDNLWNDYRFGDIEIEWMDFELRSSADEDEWDGFEEEDGEGREDQDEPAGGGGVLTFGSVRATNTESQTSSSDAPHLVAPTVIPTLRQRKARKPAIVLTSGVFVPVRSGKTQLNSGVLHLYREKSEVESILASAQLDPHSESAPNALDEEMKGFSTVMAVLAVPSYMTPQDFLTFVGPVRKYVSHFRLVRDSIPNRYIVLLKFRAPKWADLFYAQYNGRRFNSMEPEECHVVYVKSVEFVSKAIPPHAFPPLLEDYQALLKLAGRGTHPDEPDSPPQPATTTSPTHLVELPTCPVCLERMDSTVTGLLTIVCQHTFHCQCLAKWGDSSCPVCRYSQQKMEPLEDSLNECNDCGATVNLWICLICGNIGCGRYRQAHAYQHFADTNHLYSLELETQRVWDYAGDGYVHRLIQNRDDGKLVELPAPAASSSEVDVSQSGGTTPVGLGILNGRSPRLGGGGSRRGGGMASVRGRGASMEPMDEKRTGEIPAMEEQDKVDAVGLEYSYLLISQLESQRHYFEARMEEVTRTMGSKIEGLEAQVQTISVDFDEVRRERDEIKSKLPEILKARQKMEKRAEKLGERVEALERELAEEKEMNRSLRDNQDVWKKEVEAKEAEVKAKEKEVGELKEQVQDLMFFLETQKKVEDSPMREELRSGKVVVTPGGSSSSSQRRKGRK